MEKYLKALADEARLQILDFLHDKAKTSNELKVFLNKSQSTVSTHLSTLVDAGILEFKKDGTKKIYRVKHPEVYDILNSINSIIQKIEFERVKKITSDSISDTLS